MGWNDVKASATTSGSFLKLDPNVTHNVWFIGEPDVRREHWTGSRSEQCQGTGCPYCSEFGDPRDRYYVTVKTEDGEEHKAAGSFKFGNALVEAFNKTGADKFYATKFALTRTGMGKNTDYTIVAVGEAQAPDAVSDIPF